MHSKHVDLTRDSAMYSRYVPTVSYSCWKYCIIFIACWLS